MKTLHLLLAVAGIGLLLGPPARTRAADPVAPSKTALDDYVARRDSSYSWKLVKTLPGDGCRRWTAPSGNTGW